MTSNLVCVLVGVFSRQPRVKNIKSKGGDLYLYQRHLFENQELSYNHKNYMYAALQLARLSANNFRYRQKFLFES